MKYIKILRINLKDFISIDFKKITIRSLVIKQNDFNDDYINQYLNEIDYFLNNSKKNDYPDVNNFSKEYDYLLIVYLEYLTKHGIINTKKHQKLIFSSPRFCYDVIENRNGNIDQKQNVINLKDISDEKLEDVILNDPYYAFQYATNFIYNKPFKKLEESDTFNYFDKSNPSFISMQIQYLKRNVIYYYQQKLDDLSKVFIEVIKNPKYKKMLDNILTSSISGGNKFNIFDSKYLKEFMIYIIENHINLFREYYDYLKHQKINLNEVDDLIFNYIDAIIQWFMYVDSPFNTISFLKNRDRIEKMFIQNIEELKDYLALFRIKNSNINNFFDRRLDDIIKKLVKINDEERLHSILVFLYPYLSSYFIYSTNKTNFRVYIDERMRAYPEFIKHISKYPSLAFQYIEFTKLPFPDI